MNAVSPAFPVARPGSKGTAGAAGPSRAGRIHQHRHPGPVATQAAPQAALATAALGAAALIGGCLAGVALRRCESCSSRGRVRCEPCRHTGLANHLLWAPAKDPGWGARGS
ncbi:hypothetical protein TSOC_012123 [Tetrabaena socialis]|uniref:Uncharacterized protein n=1 Tax=Tetrabaena socialis TaxID=47790 RepID=A0A2J7ZNW3_9CHLO|nr:hypothetical protein TSOC_012123 [Tetrabaena socialis]|eukprot:PNH01948.1 hypothetical protein TSOC_012123 [Tetrabaena socialis]